jgi:hypothetical protein
VVVRVRGKSLTSDVQCGGEIAVSLSEECGVARIEKIEAMAKADERPYDRGVDAVTAAGPPPRLLGGELPKIDPVAEPIVVVLADPELVTPDELFGRCPTRAVKCDECAVIVEGGLARRNLGRE